MLTKEQVQTLERNVDRFERPILSLYVQTRGSDMHETDVRARETMASLEVPEDLQKRALSSLRESGNRAPTVAIFGDRRRMSVVTLPLELPVIDPRTGHVEAQYGEPYVAPLLMALGEHARYQVVVVDRDRVRIFEIFLGEIEEIERASRAPSGIEADSLQPPKQSFPRYIPSRDNAAKDRAVDRTREWMRRFYGEVSNDLVQIMTERGIDRLVLVGPERDVAMFESLLPKPIAEQVAAKTSSLPDPDAPPSAVLEKLSPTLERLEEERTRAIVDRVENAGIRSVDACITALQHGRLHTVIAAWGQETTIFENEETGRIAMSADDARTRFDEDGAVRTRRLIEVLPRLADDFGARLIFVRGDEGERVARELGGMGGLPRW